jgi:uroporphyrinogen decarboxylase
MTPKDAAEVTLQPVQRFDVDAAILFSDILLVPFALGKEIKFDDGVGPRLERTFSPDELRMEHEEWERKLAPVYEAMRLVDDRLEAGKDILGFAGGPWTLATYMAEGQGSSDQREAKLWGYRDPAGFANLLTRIATCVAHHLVRQIEAGATVVQIFDSWAGGLSEHAFLEWVIEPTKLVVERVRRSSSAAKIIGFPRGATVEGYERYVTETGVDGVSIDTALPIGSAVERLGGHAALQGNLDPILLLAGGPTMIREIDRLLAATENVPFIANLGHGVLPQTPVEHVAEFIARVRSLH